MVLAAIYAVMLAVWIIYIRQHPNKVRVCSFTVAAASPPSHDLCHAVPTRGAHIAQTHHVHHMMTVLVVFKMLSLFFEGVTWFNVRSHGTAVGWNVLYYIFAFLKGIMLFVVVLLVGTGWSLLKVRYSPTACTCRALCCGVHAVHAGAMLFAAWPSHRCVRVAVCPWHSRS